MHKQCSKCNIEKDLKNFYKNPRSKAGYKAECKSCGKMRYEKNKKTLVPEEIEIRKLKNRDRARIYREKDRGDINKRVERLEKKRQYRIKNKEKIAKYHKEYCYNRGHTDIEYKLRRNLRGRLNCALKNNSKTGSAVRDLGCSISEFKIYLESKFTEGMSWDNYGLFGWHIDHIIPLAKFNLTNREDFLKAAHYTNLQPLWAIDNITKKDNISYERKTC